MATFYCMICGGPFGGGEEMGRDFERELAELPGWLFQKISLMRHSCCDDNPRCIHHERANEDRYIHFSLSSSCRLYLSKTPT